MVKEHTPKTVDNKIDPVVEEILDTVREFKQKGGEFNRTFLKIFAQAAAHGTVSGVNRDDAKTPSMRYMNPLVHSAGISQEQMNALNDEQKEQVDNGLQDIFVTEIDYTKTLPSLIDRY